MPHNPFMKVPKSTNKETFRYKVVNAETQQMTASLEKKYFIRKNELKTFKNRILKDVDPVHRLVFGKRTLTIQTMKN
jgi:hypothetical protein